MKASEKLMKRNEFFAALTSADRGLRNELSKRPDDPTKRTPAVIERALSRREYIGKQIIMLGGAPWAFNPDDADKDYVGSVSDAENQEHRAGSGSDSGESGSVADYEFGSGPGSGWGGDDGPAAV